MGTDSGAADLPDDAVVPDEEDAAVVCVCHRHRPVGQDVRVVGPVQLVRASTLHAGRAVETRDGVCPDVDRDDVLVILLVRDERLPAGLDERVVVEDEPAALRPVGARRESPENPPVGVDEEDPVVATVGDQQGTGKRPADRDRRIRDAGAPPRTLCRQERLVLGSRLRIRVVARQHAHDGDCHEQEDGEQWQLGTPPAAPTAPPFRGSSHPCSRMLA
jgi:hypothetical protein